MAKNRIINGKLYFEEVNFDQIIKDNKNKIIEKLKEQLNTSSFKYYKDDAFKSFIEAIYNEELEIILSPNNKNYRLFFNLAVLEFGSYEYIHNLFLKKDNEDEKKYLEELDERIKTIQDALIEYIPERDETFTNKMQKIYYNFLENIAPQRLISYTTPPIDNKEIEMIFGMKNLKDITINNYFIASSLCDKFIDFNSVYGLEEIIKLIEMCGQYSNTDLNSKKIILKQMDDIIKNGITRSGIRFGLANFIHPYCLKTLDIVIEILLINKFPNSSYLEDIKMLLNKYSKIKEIMEIDRVYTDYLAFHKLLQLIYTDIIDENEKEVIINYLEDEFNINEIKDIDILEFDKKINNNEDFSIDDVKEFYNKLMRLTVKEGIMPIKYCEFIISKLIERSQNFSIGLDENQKIIILEYFARIKSNQLIGADNYITFSDNFIKKNEIGNHKDKYEIIGFTNEKNEILNIIMAIITILHELRHEQIQRMKNSKNYDYIVYMGKKEDIIKKSDRNYYDRNYFIIYEELDAEYFALNNTFNFLNSLNFDEEFKKSEDYNSIISFLNNKIKEIENGFKKANLKEFKDGKIMDVNSYFDQYVTEHPEIIKEESILRVEYNDDGTRKTITQVFKDFIDIMRFKENRLGNYDLYKKILISRIDMNKENLEELRKIKIPNNLSYSTRNAIEIIREIVITKDKDLKLQNIENIDEKNDEIITQESKETYDKIFGDDR